MSIALAPAQMRALARSRRVAAIGFMGRGVTGRVQNSLSGRIHPRIRATIEAMVAQRMLRMDEVTARLLLHAGCNPAVAAATALVAASDRTPEITIERDGVGFAWIGRMTHVRIGTGWWRPGGGVLEYMPAIPETMGERVVGMPLRTVASHPALDDLDLCVVGHERSEDGRHGHLRIEGLRWLSGELAEHLNRCEGEKKGYSYFRVETG